MLRVTSAKQFSKTQQPERLSSKSLIEVVKEEKLRCSHQHRMWEHKAMLSPKWRSAARGRLLQVTAHVCEAAGSWGSRQSPKPSSIIYIYIWYTVYMILCKLYICKTIYSFISIYIYIYIDIYIYISLYITHSRSAYPTNPGGGAGDGIEGWPGGRKSKSLGGYLAKCLPNFYPV